MLDQPKHAKGASGDRQGAIDGDDTDGGDEEEVDESMDELLNNDAGMHADDSMSGTNCSDEESGAVDSSEEEEESEMESEHEATVWARKDINSEQGDETFTGDIPPLPETSQPDETTIYNDDPTIGDASMADDIAAAHDIVAADDGAAADDAAAADAGEASEAAYVCTNDPQLPATMPTNAP